ncbi:MAG TPA: histidine kinase [Acidimicrobiales bacterium]|nr:histidine kinase [Acidimicrobiales bacterium]
MERGDRACPEDSLRGGLPWSERVPQAVGLFVVCVGVAIAAQRHQFIRPNLDLLVIAAITVPWVLDMFAWPKFLLRGWRFEYPVLVVWSVVVLAGAYWLSISFRESYDYSPFFVTILIGEMAATAGPKFGAAVWAAGVAGLIVLTTVNHFSGMAIWAFAFTIGWMGGTAYRTQVKVAYELAEAQSRLAAQAVEDERHRLARDIHDLIAHSLAVTMLQLSGARLALKAGESEEALAALEDAEAAGRSAMAEIHRTVGLLGSPGTDSAQYATPRAADLPRLVADFRRAGLAVDFQLDGDLDAVPLATGLAAYRVVQESLANAVKHAPGAPVRLWVSVTSEDIRVSVVNPVVAGAASGMPAGGNGLRGMSERAELLGGVAAAGNGDGTWKVDARLPLSAPPV